MLPSTSRPRTAARTSLLFTSILASAAALALGYSSCVRQPFGQCSGDLICPTGYRCSTQGDYCVDIQSQESCGDGFTDGEEQCDCGDETLIDSPSLGCTDDFNDDSGGLCRTDCQLHCGDGALAEQEPCDGDLRPTDESCVDSGYDIDHLDCNESCNGFDTGPCSLFDWSELLARFEVRDTLLLGVWAASSSDVFAVGEGGIILKQENEDSWVRQGSPTTSDLLDIVGFSEEDLFAVGDNGTILHSDGEAWTAMDSSASGTRLQAVWGASNADVFAIGGPVILHYDGAAWTQTTPPENVDLTDIHGVSASSIVAVGNGGTILRHDGASWSVDPSPTTSDLSAVWGDEASGEFFAVGSSATIARHDGSSWTLMASPATDDFVDVWGVSSAAVLALTDGGDLYYYNGTSWMRQGETTIDGAVAALTGITAQDLYAVGSLNDIESQRSAMIWHHDGYSSSVPPHPALTGSLVDVWGSSPSNVFAAGLGGVVLHYDGRSGDTWSQISVPLPYQTCDFQGLWGIDATAVYATCILPSRSVILRYDGAAWTELHAIDGVELRSISGTAPDDIVVVGSGGTIVHHDGATWSVIASPTQNDLLDVWAIDSSDIWAVGRSDTALRYDGTQWSLVTSPTAGTDDLLRSVWASSSDDVFIVTHFGRILHHDGSDLTVMNAPLGGTLRSVVGASADDIFAVGMTALHYDGVNWEPVRSRDIEDHAAVWPFTELVVFTSFDVTTTPTMNHLRRL